MSKGDFPEVLSQQILVGRLGVGTADRNHMLFSESSKCVWNPPLTACFE